MIVKSHIGGLYYTLEGDFAKLMKPDSSCCYWDSSVENKRMTTMPKDYDNYEPHVSKALSNEIEEKHTPYERRKTKNIENLLDEACSPGPGRVIDHSELQSLWDDDKFSPKKKGSHSRYPKKKLVDTIHQTLSDPTIEQSFKRKHAMLSFESRRGMDAQQARIWQNHAEYHFQRIQSVSGSEIIISGVGRHQREQQPTK